MFINKNTLLESLTHDDIVKLVTSLGSAEPKHDKDGNIIAQTICHNAPNPKNSYKLYYYFPNENDDSGRKYGLFHCYSGCGGDSFDAIELVIRAMRAQGKTFTWYKALSYVATITGKTNLNADEIQTEKPTTIEDFEWINRFKKTKHSQRQAPTLKAINPNVLDVFAYYPHQDWVDDKCSEEALHRFCISYYGLQNSIIIPHYDINENLIGVRQRFLDEWDVENIGKYVPLQINGEFLAHSLGSNLYGINVAAEAIRRTKKAIVYESEKSVIQNYSYFGDNSYAVAVCGSKFSKVQFKLLMSLGVEEIQIAFDKEYADHTSFEAEAYYNKLTKMIKPYLPYCKFALVMDRQNLLDQKDSPSDKGKEVLLKLLEDKIMVQNM